MNVSGYDWSIRSMETTIDVLHDAMLIVAGDGKKFLDEKFMNTIFSKIDEDKGGNACPLQPFVDAMHFYMGEFI